MQLRYSDIFHQNMYFQRAVNLALDAGRLDFVDHYIPTKASALILKRYLRASIDSTQDRASVLIGPYGKGKSHTMFLALSILSEDSAEADLSFRNLAARLENVDEEAADLVRHIRTNKIRLLPIVINNRYLNIRQAFLASLKSALTDKELSELLPNNYFAQCQEVIQRWKVEFPKTYEAYDKYLRNRGLAPAELEMRLGQYDSDALRQFKECYRTILSGAEFDPLLESDVPSLFEAVSRSLTERSEFSGIFVVFDEFGKFLESVAEQQKKPDFVILQDLAEICCRSDNPRMLLTCISHKSISSYAEHASATQVQSFRTVEGRFSPIYFTSNFEGNFSLIAGALGRDANAYKSFISQHQTEHKQTVDDCTNLGCICGLSQFLAQ